MPLDKLVLELTAEHLQAVMKGLGKIPFKEAAPVIAHIGQSTLAQQAAFESAAAHTAKQAEKNRRMDAKLAAVPKGNSENRSATKSDSTPLA